MSLSPEEHRRLSRAVLDGLMRGFSAIRQERVGLYWPFRGEINLFPFANRVIAAGGEVSLPALRQPRRPMQFRAWTPGDPLASGGHDIPFPRDGPAVRPDVLIIPMLGFDAACHRLGYGGGAYDRTLAAAAVKPLAIGVGFEFMRLTSVDPPPDDIPMDFIVTEIGVFPRPGGGRC